MKIKDDFILREISNAYVVVPVGQAAVDFNGMINLNETGAFLWSLLRKETTEKKLLKEVISEYNISEEIAAMHIENFIHKLKRAGLLE